MVCSRYTLNCEKDPASPGFRYAERGDDAPLCCASHIVELVFTVTELLDAANIPYFVYWGTLLGAARHGGMIPWDQDADLGVPLDYRDRVHALAPALRARGHHLHVRLGGRDRNVGVYYSTTNLLHVDIDFWERDGAAWRDCQWGCTQADAELFPLRGYRFHGATLRGSATLAGLFAWYGDDCLTVGRREFWLAPGAEGERDDDPRRKQTRAGVESEFPPARIDLDRDFAAEPAAWQCRLRHRLTAIWTRRVIENRFYLFNVALSLPRKVLPAGLRDWLWRVLGERLHRQIR